MRIQTMSVHALAVGPAIEPVPLDIHTGKGIIGLPVLSSGV
jgi:hypothetical protein